MKVAVLVTTTKHGNDISVYLTLRSAQDALEAYVDEYWDDEVNGRLDEPIDLADLTAPASDMTWADAVNIYFQTVVDEDYQLLECEVHA